MQKPTPAPIFNHRKRPRQAVFADPQNGVMPGPSGAASVPTYSRPKFSDLMPLQGFGRGRGRNPTAVPQQRPQARHRSNTDLSGEVLSSYRNQQPNRPISSNRGGFQYKQYSGNQSSSSISQKTGGARANTNVVSSRPSQQTGGYQPNSNQAYQPSIASGQSMDCPRYPGPYGDFGQQQQSGPSFYFRNQSQQNQYGRGTARNYPVAAEMRPTFAPNSSFGDGAAFNDSLNVDDQNKPSTSAVVPKKTSSDFEKSLHTITCTVAGMRRWNKFRDSIQLLVEVYGYIDSAITKQGRGCKEFLMRDDRKDAVKCHFYEVDRHLPKLTRGQRIRCVGNLDTKTDIFKVMSVRPSQEAERELYKTLVSRSDQLMQIKTKNLREI